MKEKKKKKTDYGSLMTVTNILGAKFCYERRQKDNTATFNYLSRR